MSPEELKNSEEFRLLTEVEHTKIKRFVLEQVNFESKLIRSYSVYQVGLILAFIFLLVRSISLMNRGLNEALHYQLLAVVFSFTFLVVIHEMIHALAYLLTGVRNLKFGAIWRKFIFYVIADREVVNYSSFRLVAWAPFLVVKVLCLLLGIWFWSSPLAFFFFSVMCIHSLFCAGDMAMLAFYQMHPEKEIFNYDDVSEGKTYFYFRRSAKQHSASNV